MSVGERASELAGLDAPDSGSESPEGADRFRQIAEIAKLIHESTDLQEIFCRLTEGVCRLSKWDMSSIQVLDTRTQRTMPIVRFDPRTPERIGKFQEWDATNSPLTSIIASGSPLVLQDAAEQTDFRGFQQDARAKGYHTVVMVPLEYLDEIGRSIVFTVLSRSVVEVGDDEISFLQCLADLSGVAVRRMQVLRDERREAERLQSIVRNLTSALAMTLDASVAEDVYGELTRLFPTGWFAIDLTTGRGIADSTASSFVHSVVNQPPRQVFDIALKAADDASGRIVQLAAGEETRKVLVQGLTIDGSRVGALFLLEAENLSEHEKIAAEAGRLALSTLILRDYMLFKSGRVTARRLITRLAEGGVQSGDEILKEAQILGFDLLKPSRLVLIGLGEGQFEDGPQSFILRTAQSVFGPAISAMLDGHIVILLNDSEALASERARTDFLKRIRPVLPAGATLTQSARITGPAMAAGALETCRRRLQVGSAMNASGWISEREIGAFSLLMSSLSGPEAERFLASKIGRIADGGSPKGRVAIETLSTFLETGRRLQDTARLLNIHVSTLRYRLARLAEAHDLDLMDSEACFELELALRLQKLRTSYET